MSQKTKVLVVDDEPLAIGLLKEYIDRVPQLELSATAADAIQALQVLNEQDIDLIFLDIEMPELNGIQFLKSLSIQPKVIITTAFREYAIESYEVDVVDYLLKPISFNRFFKSISKYLNTNTTQSQTVSQSNNENSKSGSIYVYSDKKNIKVYFDDIVYIESIKDYVRIHKQDRNIISKSTISKYEELLPSNFIRIHRSFIVNTDKITAFTQHDIEIGEKEIPIGTSYKQKVQEALKALD